METKFFYLVLDGSVLFPSTAVFFKKKIVNKSKKKKKKLKYFIYICCRGEFICNKLNMIQNFESFACSSLTYIFLFYLLLTGLVVVIRLQY